MGLSGRVAAVATVVLALLSSCAAEERRPDDGAGTSPTSSTAETPALQAHAISKDIGTGVEIRVTIDLSRWQGEPNGGYVEDGDVAVIAFNDREYFPYGNPCRWTSSGPRTPVTTARELVALLAKQELRTPSTPEAVMVDGRPGWRVVLRMDAGDLRFRAGGFPDCDDAHFSLLGVAGEQPARWSQAPGQVEEVWAVDVGGAIAVLIGLYYPETPQEDVNRVRALLASMTFST